MAKYTRTSIAIPVDLKARMEAVKIPESWSQVACKAFEKRLAEIVEKEGAKNLDDVVLRMRNALENGPEIQEYLKGRSVGDQWVWNSASPAHVEHMFRLRERLRRENEGLQHWLESVGVQTQFTPGQAVGLEILGVARDHLEYFKETAGDLVEAIFREAGIATDKISKSMLRGFVDAAADLWLEIEKRL
jgi:hypothetical protein